LKTRNFLSRSTGSGRKGVEVDIASLQKGTIKGKHGYEVAVNKTLDDITPDEYSLLTIGDDHRGR
jgi:hypothetical protein